jgi:hypothetical protein
LLCVVVASVVQDEKVVEWNEVSALVWPVHPGSGSRSGDNRSQDSPWSSSFVPSPHGTMGSSRYLAHDDILEATDGDDISIRTTEEMEKYESPPPSRVCSHLCLRYELT